MRRARIIHIAREVTAPFDMLDSARAAHAAIAVEQFLAEIYSGAR